MSPTNVNGNGASVTWKALITFAGTFAGVFSIVTATIMVPLIRDIARQVVDREMERHASVPHPGVVTQDSLMLMVGRLDSRLARIEEKLLTK